MPTVRTALQSLPPAMRWVLGVSLLLKLAVVALTTHVELVLDEMRPYLIADGGNVALRDIDAGVVVLELQGACGSCPSSSMTMKMGLERVGAQRSERRSL